MGAVILVFPQTVCNLEVIIILYSGLHLRSHHYTALLYENRKGLEMYP